MKFLRSSFLLPLLMLICCGELNAQRYLADYDSTLFVRDTLRPLVSRFQNLHLSAYMQPQYQIAESKGIQTFAGGNFQPNAGNRFMLRRSRLKLDYRLTAKDGGTAAVFTFQFEVTERDANVRDMFLRVFEPSGKNLSLVAGLFSRPFGYEVNLSSSFRETPERGRMSQTLMPSERDLGAMVTYDPRKGKRKQLPLKFDIGFFNGQGKSGPAEFDSYKDLISRLTLKPLALGQSFSVSGGLSLLRGGWAQATKYRYTMGAGSDSRRFLVDSNEANIGSRSPRKYHGADLQLIKRTGWGKTEIRGEYWRGTQPGTASTTVNPGTLPKEPSYIRPFDGAFFYFLQNILNEKWELMVKYDWYDQNRNVSGMDIGKPGSFLTEADIRYGTLGAGLTHYFSDNLKVLAYYDRVHNEATMLPGFTRDLKDDVFTLRMQFRF